MFSEVLHGLVGRTQRDAGVDQDQPRASLVPSPLRIGIIPAGTWAGRGPPWVFLEAHPFISGALFSPRT